ncbi:MAG: tRNA dihydrouridine synthase DusB, partial [bacterium]|nr:tRNA dihydrouridine synthase DusB [bacterium]
MKQIANVKLKNKVFLAPMAGINDQAFRKIIKEMGCALVYTEMISDKGIIYNNKKTVELIKFDEIERPIAIQIFGNDKKTLVESALFIEKEVRPDIIDINMGCPVPKIAVKSQAGSSLLKNPEKIYEIVSAVVKATHTPITVKIRSGWDENSINAPLVAKMCEKAGAVAIAIHGRTRSQGYTGKSDLKIIKEVKESVNIPVIGNGDITDITSAKRMLEETNCDFLMVGRGVLGNPWLIKEINTYLETGEIIPLPTSDDRINMCLRHLKYLIESKGEKLATLEIRKHIAWYIKGLPNAKEVKNAVFQAKNTNNI